MSVAPAQFDREEREVEFSRALAFSDGVFAFAITLLVTTIDVPQLSGPGVEQRLVERLDELLPFLATYFLSFAVIGLMWLRHHRLFSRIRRLDTRALTLNLVALSFVVLMPFSTEMLGRYGDIPAGVSFYALNLALAALTFAALWWHCVRHDMLGEQPTPSMLRAELMVRLMVVVGFLISIPLAFWSTTAAPVCWAVFTVGQQVAMRRLAAEGRISEND